jgi:hypothetical protein
VVLNEHETLCVTWREEHSLRVFGNRVPRRIFGSKRQEVTGSWGTFHEEERHNLYSSPSVIRFLISRRVKCGGHVDRMGENRRAYIVPRKLIYDICI